MLPLDGTLSTPYSGGASAFKVAGLIDVARCYSDFAYFAESCLKVLDLKTGQPVPLRLKPVQKRLTAAICADLDAGRPARYIVLKARREGVSTAVQALFYWRGATRRYQSTMTLSHHDQTTGVLHGILERFHTFMPPGLKPENRQSRRQEVLELADKRGTGGQHSIFRTVTFKNAGAGQAANLVHCSEVGLWGSDAQTTLATLLPVVPYAAGTIVVLESTARGVGNTFHEEWLKAERGESQFTPFFIPWFEEPVYDHPDGADDLGVLDDDELELRERGVSDSQLAWRRFIGIPGQPSLDSFHQEYPSTPEEAFLSSGRPFFDQQKVAELRRASKPPEWRGDLVEDAGRISPKPNPKGRLQVWEMPDPAEDYLIAADPSAGLDSGDPQAACVYKRSTLTCVATWHGHEDNNDLGDILYCLGKVYNQAVIAVEINSGWGEAVIGTLRRRYYPRIYRKRDENKHRSLRERKYGWMTTIATRPKALEALRDAIKHDDITCLDEELWRECHTFVIDENEKPRAESGAHDDRVMCHAIACYLWASEPTVKQSVYTTRVEPRRPLSAITGY